jgi:hypothetical protein
MPQAVSGCAGKHGSFDSGINSRRIDFLRSG